MRRLTSFLLVLLLGFVMIISTQGASIRRKRDPSALYDLQRRLIRSYRNSYKNSHSASSSQRGTVGSGHAEGVMPSPEDGIMQPNNPFLTVRATRASAGASEGSLQADGYGDADSFFSEW